MVLFLIISSLILGGYSLYLIKKLNKKLNTHIDDIHNLISIQLDKNKLYLLEKIDSKSKENINFLIKELHKINDKNKDQINIKHQQLVSNEIKNLRSDLNKDLDDIVESVKNIKIY